MTNPQYEYLLDVLDSPPFSISEIKIGNMLLQIDWFLFEFNVFGDPREIDDDSELLQPAIAVDELLPARILEDQLGPEYNKEGLAKWHWFLAIYLKNEILKRDLKDNEKWVNAAIGAINQSKQYFSQHDLHMRRVEREIREARRNEGTKSNNKRYEPLNLLKQAACDQYESAIAELQLQRQIDKQKTPTNRITYKNVAKIIYPKLAHLNEDQNGQKMIGRNGDPVGSLARILKEAARKDKLKPIRGR